MARILTPAGFAMGLMALRNQGGRNAILAENLTATIDALSLALRSERRARHFCGQVDYRRQAAFASNRVEEWL